MAPFEPATKGSGQEEGTDLRPRFDAAGLITAIAQDGETGEILMLAHMNAEALRLTLETGKAHYYSRSRQQIWLKGETSGNVQLVQSVLVDCDQDAVLIKVTMSGDRVACHTGRVTCFYRRVQRHADGGYSLAMDWRE
ncbi:MAG: phosphoribosyl-AMP cyclohydrolase [Nitratireductor sp.]|nr:phosphoribosyl-AMP cyclohydrolase [Nitratireductor sp.]